MKNRKKMKGVVMMMRKIRFIWVLALIAMVLVLVSCDIGTKDDGKDNGTQTTGKYKDFFNYPDGRKNPTGTLEIRNSVAFPVLVFTDSVTPANYVGTIDSLSSIRVKLPEQKFYTIVAVDKATWEERGDQASQFSDLTYYSFNQPYSMAVRPTNTYGGGTWYIYNQTDYWVSFKDVNQSGVIYAVAPPRALRFSVPVSIGQNIDYVPHFYKQLKFNGNVIALVESDLTSEINTVVTSQAKPTFYTEIGTDIKPPSTNIKPAIFFTNSCDRSVRVFSGTNNQLSAIGMIPGADFALASGDDQMFTDLADGAITTSINVLLPSGDRKWVTANYTMETDKVYRIVLNGNNRDGYTFAVTVEEASKYFN